MRTHAEARQRHCVLCPASLLSWIYSLDAASLTELGTRFAASKLQQMPISTSYSTGESHAYLFYQGAGDLNFV